MVLVVLIPDLFPLSYFYWYQIFAKDSVVVKLVWGLPNIELARILSLFCI